MKILIFDLDDTLVDDHKYVESGLRAVANQVSIDFSKIKVLKIFNQILKVNGRGKIFNIFFESFLSKKNLNKYIKLYRSHYPNRFLKPEAKKLLINLKKKGYNLYLVTDGHKLSQNQKIKRLKLSEYFKKTYVTHNYGADKMKPSLFIFKKIKKDEKVEWSDIVYIGDNPKKDFVNLNSVGAITIRILTGPYKNLKVNKKFDAKFKIKSLKNFNLKFINRD